MPVTINGSIGVTIPWQVKTSAYTLVEGQSVLANTSAGAFTLTLPLSPGAGTFVYIADFAGTWDTNNLTVARNGSTIESLAEDLTCNVANVNLTMYYTGTTWTILN